MRNLILYAQRTVMSQTNKIISLETHDIRFPTYA
jgi:hypothetical protein